nr:MAG TPA: hypothetical protein [Siphoviridae sp. ct5YG1]DAP26864.1 MAG TPA: hypothetical protein [Caudoviricetes sp.]DAU41856.1 MAG TPA: hypothetical protein [Bacteriophage sp.]
MIVDARASALRRPDYKRQGGFFEDRSTDPAF